MIIYMKLKYKEFLTSLLPVPANVDDYQYDNRYDSERNQNEYV